MRVEIQKNQDLSNLVITANTPIDERPSLYFPPSNPKHAPNNPPTISTQKTPTIDLTTPNPNHAHIKPHPLLKA